MKKVINPFLNFNRSYDEVYGLSRKILIIGAGVSGKACARWLEKEGKIVKIVDSREFKSKKINGSNLLINSGIKFPLCDEWFDQVDLLIVSPGLSPYASKESGLAPMLETTKKRNIPVMTELDLFDVVTKRYLTRSKNNRHPNNDKKSNIPIIAVTGTNGKTSVVKLITKLLNSVGIDAQHAGNISPSLLEAYMERHAANKMPEIWVLELSSFQLALSKQFSPTFSTILNLSDDHFDWHLNREEYLYSKLKVFGIPKPTAKAFIWRNDIELSKKIQQYFKTNESDFKFATFGVDLPEKNKCFGISKSKKFCFKTSSIKNQFFEFPLHTKDVNLIGNHNYSNITCCLSIVSEVSNNFSIMAKILKAHIGEPHRLENFLSIDNIHYIDDSKATNIGATISAINALKEPIILILGGLSKKQNFDFLTDILNTRKIDLIVFGENTLSICESLKNSNLFFNKVNNLKEAVNLAMRIAKEKVYLLQKKEIQVNVLLSPACSSLDMFDNYQHRGAEFKKLVSDDHYGDRKS